VQWHGRTIAPVERLTTRFDNSAPREAASCHRLNAPWQRNSLVVVFEVNRVDVHPAAGFGWHTLLSRRATASMCRPNCLPRSCLCLPTSQKTTQRVAKAVDPSVTVVDVQQPPATLSMSSTTSVVGEEGIHQAHPKKLMHQPL
jgi:hypothetical protein